MHTPKHLIKTWQLEKPMKCQRADEGNCRGRLTKEHALIYAGKQIQEDWSVLNICAFHHAVDEYVNSGGMNKEKHEWLALRQAPRETREKYYKMDWSKLDRLNKKYA
jgi:hypothetical protein